MSSPFVVLPPVWGKSLKTGFFNPCRYRAGNTDI
jgi:hypothetical protein